MPQLVLDLDIGRVTRTTGTTELTETAQLQRSSRELLAVKVVRYGALVTTEIADFELKFVAIARAAWGSDLVISETGFTFDADAKAYIGWLNLITTGLDALMHIDDVGGDERDDLVISGQLLYRFDSGDDWSPTQNLYVTVNNSASRGDAAAVTLSGLHFSMDTDGHLVITNPDGDSFFLTPFEGAP